MKFLFTVLIATIYSCHTPKAANAKNEVAPEGSVVVADSLPVCVNVLIEKFKSEPMTNPPRKITRYTYNDKTVYYVPAVCCDNYSDLYNDSCRMMGHPDGGFTGRGDGKLPDFNTNKKDEKLLWSDPRAGK